MSIAVGAVTVLLSLEFLAAGGRKLVRKGLAASRAARDLGVPGWLLRVIGGAEVALATALLVPSVRAFALAVLTVLMLGAVGTHLRAGHPLRRALPAVATLVLLAICQALA